jgi:hypothetical protein
MVDRKIREDALSTWGWREENEEVICHGITQPG